MSQNEIFLQNKTNQHHVVWIIFLMIFTVVVAHSAMAAESANDHAAEAPRAPSSIDHAVMALTQPSHFFYGQDGEAISPELIATYNAIKAEEKPMNVCNYVPTDMAPTSNSGQVFSRIADKTTGTYFSSPEFRAMPIGGAATQVEKSMQTNVVIGGQNPNEIQHKFDFNVQAFQALAKIQYTGFTTAAVMYYALQSKVSLEVSEKIFGSKDLVFGQDFTPANDLSQVSFRWKF